jgi:hypothetical protein
MNNLLCANLFLVVQCHLLVIRIFAVNVAKNEILEKPDLFQFYNGITVCREKIVELFLCFIMKFKRLYFWTRKFLNFPCKMIKYVPHLRKPSKRGRRLGAEGFTTLLNNGAWRRPVAIRSLS